MRFIAFGHIISIVSIEKSDEWANRVVEAVNQEYVADLWYPFKNKIERIKAVRRFSKMFPERWTKENGGVVSLSDAKTFVESHW